MKVECFDSSWYSALEDEFTKDYWVNLTNSVRKLYKSKTIYPHPKNIFNAFNSTPLDNVKVVILGQDPYHGPGQAHGLSFSVEKDRKIPPSLRNIYKELSNDLNIPVPETGNLQSWANQGVLLLNRVLTVEATQANSHKGLGWESFTEAVIRVISEKLDNVVFILWGRAANADCSALVNRNKHLLLSSVHPSPLSAHGGFFGCKHFSKTNEYLIEHNKQPIDWSIN